MIDSILQSFYSNSKELASVLGNNLDHPYGYATLVGEELFTEYIFITVGDIIYGFYTITASGSAENNYAKIARINGTEINVYTVYGYYGNLYANMSTGVDRTGHLYYIEELETFYMLNINGYNWLPKPCTILKSSIDNGTPQIRVGAEVSNTAECVIGYANNTYYILYKGSKNFILYYSANIASFSNRSIAGTNNGGVYITDKIISQKCTFVCNNKMYVVLYNKRGTRYNLYTAYGVVMITSPDEVSQYNIKVNIDNLSSIVSQMFDTTISITDYRFFYSIYIESNRYMIGSMNIVSTYSSYIYIVFRVPLFTTEYQEEINTEITISSENVIPTIIFSEQLFSNTHPYNEILLQDKILAFNSSIIENTFLSKIGDDYYILYTDNTILTKNMYNNKNNINNLPKIFKFSFNRFSMENLPDIIYYPVCMDVSNISPIYVTSLSISNSYVIYVYKRYQKLPNIYTLYIPFYSTPMINNGKGYIKAKT